jgi:hypothetical protein
MLAMDVVDTLRHQQDLVDRELNGEARAQALIERLRTLYREQGITVSDDVLKAGVKALGEKRFSYSPVPPGLMRALALFYVRRSIWLPVLFATGLALTIGLGGYYFGWVAFRDAQVVAAKTELTTTLPEAMDAVYASIFEETKVQQAVGEAEDLRTRGKAAAAEGDRAAAEGALADLRALSDRLRRDFTLRIVNQQGVKSGFWTFPEINTEATNYYIVVEAVGSDGRTLSLPIANEETGTVETVSRWGLRVPEATYRQIEADKRDNGIIENNIVGLKQYGFLDVDYAMPVLGGAVTRW